MLLEKLFDAFVQKGPVPLMARVLMENVLAPAKVDGLFERTAERQYCRELLFSTIVGLMSQVVCGIRQSVHAAYQASANEIAVSVTSVYNKVLGVEPNVSRALVHDTAAKMAAAIGKMGGCLPSRLPGYRLKILDGNCIAATDHRLEVLRQTNAGPLPGKSLVVLEPALGLVTDVFPCEDGHAQERSLLDSVLETIAEGDLWIADRNFCTLGFMVGIARKKGFFVIRQHQAVSGRAVGRKTGWKAIEGGKVRERNFRVEDPDNPKIVYFFRQVIVRLEKPTRDGETTIYILTNLPAKDADAATISELYRDRWTIESAFYILSEVLSCEVNSLGYPKAALFGFCVALVAYNIVATIQAALRAEHGVEKIENEVSRHYLVDEIAGAHRGMAIAIPEAKWEAFHTLSTSALATLLRQLAANVDLRLFRKHPRGPKKPRPARTQHKNKPHVSTAKLLAKRNRSP